MTKRSKSDDMTPHPHQKLFSLLAIVIFLAFCIIVGYFIGKPMLQFVSQPDQFRLWVDGHGMLGRLLFVGMVILQVVVALIPGEPLEIGAGYAFGAVEGTILCMIGVVLGGALVFWMTRKWGVKLVSLFFSVEKIRSLKILQDSKRLHVLTFFLFFIPGTPKDLLTYVAGLTPISFKFYLLLSTVGRIPSVLTSTIGGDALGNQDYLFAVITFAVVAAVSIAGLLVYRGITRHKEKNNQEDSTALPEDTTETNEQ